MDVSINAVTAAIFTLIFSQQMMPSGSRYPPGKCQKNLKSCPPGHEFESCEIRGEYRCKQCGDMLFQPNENRLGDKCRFRKICDKHFMEYRDYGTTVKDAKCQCNSGFHFENVDQRACVPNRECGKGLGQGEHGVCENCIEKMMFSDTKDRTQKCKPLRNCEKESRCTKRKSNGTFDNICGPLVRDINDCSSIVSETEGSTSPLKIGLIIGGVVVALILIAVIVALLFSRRRRKRHWLREVPPLNEEQLEELKKHILHRCEKDEDLSKKVLTVSFSQIETRIERQSWTLAQTLFRNHPITGKYEVVVETYKEKNPRDAVKGFLGEWRGWKGDNHAAVTELFHCLGNCKRDDIVYEICNMLRSDVGDVNFDNQGKATDGRASNRAQSNFMCEFGNVFPCFKTQEKVVIEKEENPETTNKLLETQSQGDQGCTGEAVYKERANPSAPTFEETNGLLTEPDVQFHRQYSQPVQATT